MSPLDRSVVFATDVLEPLVGLAQSAEAAGFRRVWTTEFTGRDAVVRALVIGLATDSIEVGTGIAYAFTRPSLSMASQAMDVQRLLGGRFTLGLGTGTRGVRRWYDASFDPPATRFEEYVRELRAAWKRISEPDFPAPPPVYGAGLNPAMLRAVGRSSEGVVLHPVAIARTHLHERVMPAIRRGCDVAASRGEERGCNVAMWIIASINPDEEAARRAARRQLAFYFSTPSYKPVLQGSPWLGVADAVQQAFADAERPIAWSALEHLIPDDLLDELCLAGTEDTVAAKAATLESELAEAGVAEMVFQTVGIDLSPEDTVRNCRGIIDALAPRSAVRAT